MVKCQTLVTPFLLLLFLFLTRVIDFVLVVIADSCCSGGDSGGVGVVIGLLLGGVGVLCCYCW